MRTRAGWIVSLTLALTLGLSVSSAQQPPPAGNPPAAQQATPAYQQAPQEGSTSTAWVLGVLITLGILVVVCIPMRRT